jgi:hypothetical protein
VKEIIDSLRTLVNSLNRIIKLINAHNRIKENSVDNAYLLEKNIGEIERLISELPDLELKNRLNTWLKKEKQDVEVFKEDFRFKFGKELTALFSKEGKRIKGQYPILRVGFYTLKLDFQFGEATLFFGPEIEKIKSKIPLQPKIIFETIKKYDNDLRTIKSTPEEIFKGLYKAYHNRLNLANKSFGEKLLITEVLNEYVMLKQSKKFFIDPQKSNFHEYSRVKLSYMLYLLKKSNLLEKGIRLHVATFDATVDKIHSIWILENEDGEGTHYSQISFEKIQNT